jgi:hypothetical protein
MLWHEKIINEYISRLFVSPNLFTFTIIERETIAIPQSNAIQTDKKTKNRKPSTCVESLLVSGIRYYVVENKKLIITNAITNAGISDFIGTGCDH